ncbi:MAG: hypothetical protein EOP09_01245 [Proteobacteria bacterium]|nr:MAG: hypothetical protein EOP09_01245 [Pseudomonadota bacterium]
MRLASPVMIPKFAAFQLHCAKANSDNVIIDLIVTDAKSDWESQEIVTFNSPVRCGNLVFDEGWSNIQGVKSSIQEEIGLSAEMGQPLIATVTPNLNAFSLTAKSRQATFEWLPRDSYCPLTEIGFDVQSATGEKLNSLRDISVSFSSGKDLSNSLKSSRIRLGKLSNGKLLSLKISDGLWIGEFVGQPRDLKLFINGEWVDARPSVFAYVSASFPFGFLYGAAVWLYATFASIREARRHLINNKNSEN